MKTYAKWRDIRNAGKSPERIAQMDAQVKADLRAMFPYRIVVEWSPVDECFIARVPSVETVAAHGDTPEVAVREAIVATELALEALAAHKRPIPPPGQRLRVVFEPDEGGWQASIPSVKGCRTWGRSIEAARTNIREALSLCADELASPEKVAATAVFDEELRSG